MSDRSERVAEVFEAALEVEARRRDAFVREACGNDERLRAAVHSLLASDARAAGFLEPASPAATDAGADPFIGQSVGRYRVERVIASGGMGTVYEAIQEQVEKSFGA